MTEKELKRLLEAMRRSTEETNTPEKARRELQEDGILDANGQLIEPYR